MGKEIKFYAFCLSVTPKSHDERKGEDRSTALTRRHRAITIADMTRPIVSMAGIELPGPADRNPFMKDRFGMKK